MLQSNKKLSVTLELVKTAKIKHKKGLSTTASIIRFELWNNTK